VIACLLLETSDSLTSRFMIMPAAITSAFRKMISALMSEGIRLYWISSEVLRLVVWCLPTRPSLVTSSSLIVGAFRWRQRSSSDAEYSV
jgi:hypothetical protein